MEQRKSAFFTEVPRLQVENVTVRFGGLTAVSEVSFRVYPGQVVALIGPNGAGKTTLFNAVCRLVKSEGTVFLDGVPLPMRASRIRRAGLSRTLQGLGLYSSMTVRENVSLPVLSRKDGVLVVDQTLDELRLQSLSDRLVSELSLPDRKRVALARALVADPTLLLLDEPAGGLGREDIDRLGASVQSLARDGRSVLLVEHNVPFVMGFADWVVVLDFGRVIAAGTPAEIRSNELVEAAYLGAQSPVTEASQKALLPEYASSPPEGVRHANR